VATNGPFKIPYTVRGSPSLISEGKEWKIKLYGISQAITKYGARIYVLYTAF
jgi:hypothetical protein